MFQKVDKPQLHKVKYLQFYCVFQMLILKNPNVNPRIINKCIHSLMDEQHKKISLIPPFFIHECTQTHVNQWGFSYISTILFAYKGRYGIGEEVKQIPPPPYTCQTTLFPDNIPLNEIKNHIQILLTWSMLSGMNSPSLLILVNDPFRATWCNSSGMYPGGGELLSLLVGPQRKKIV